MISSSHTGRQIVIVSEDEQAADPAWVPDNVHGLIDDIRLVNSNDESCSSCRSKHAEDAGATPNVKYDFITK